MSEVVDNEEEILSTTPKRASKRKLEVLYPVVPPRKEWKKFYDQHVLQYNFDKLVPIFRKGIKRRMRMSKSDPERPPNKKAKYSQFKWSRL